MPSGSPAFLAALAQPSRISFLGPMRNHQKTIKLHLTTGEDIELPHGKTSADEISDLMEKGKIETIHSSEPTLETVFIELTGRKIESEEEAKYA